jgi:hypothetical protein
MMHDVALIDVTSLSDRDTLLAVNAEGRLYHHKVTILRYIGQQALIKNAPEQLRYVKQPLPQLSEGLLIGNAE